MIFVRKSNDRGFTHIDWLKSYHSFSFGDYYDPKFMGFGNLRVINEDTVKPAMGFGMHSHRDMEIISYVIEGALEHKDSIGTGSIIKPGEIQRMSAGSGVQHSEFNPSPTQAVHFLQIWILPSKTGVAPSYEQKKILRSDKNPLVLIGSPQGGENVVTIGQAVSLYSGILDKSDSVKYTFKGQQGWLQLIKGKLSVNNHELNAGDGMAFQDEKEIVIDSLDKAEFLLFDMG